MKERPILFSGPMVQATLDGRKTHTRRIIKDIPKGSILTTHEDWDKNRRDSRMPSFELWGLRGGYAPFRTGNSVFAVQCPYGKPGDRLYVKEGFRLPIFEDALSPKQFAEKWKAKGLEFCVFPVRYEADKESRYWPTHSNSGMHAPPGRVRHAIHMPRWASRILLEITSVRVERLQDISEEDCWKEGIDAVDGWLDDLAIIEMSKRIGCCVDDAKPTFASLWESINGPGSWDANPWVWAVEFRRVPA